jgi:hypothetical protein
MRAISLVLLLACESRPRPPAPAAPPPVDATRARAIDAAAIDAAPIDAAPADAPAPDAGVRLGRAGEVCRTLDHSIERSCAAGLRCCQPGGWQGAAWTCQRSCVSLRP